MPGITIELTNRCNLKCLHCFGDRHSAEGDLGINIVESILRSARANGFDHLSFTGGEPTLHPEFEGILGMVYKAGYRFGLVSNGWNFPKIYETLLPYRDRLAGITFSLDGAREETHDSLRGKGSYRHVMSALSICTVKDIPFTLNTLITSGNRFELHEIADLAAKLGSGALRFGHLIPAPLSIENKLDFSPLERKNIDAAVFRFGKTFSMPVVMAPGHYTANLFPCAPLQMKECNIDWQGNVTFCCHLSGHGTGTGRGDVIGNLSDITFSEACKMLTKAHSRFRRNKEFRYSQNMFDDVEYFPCWYCENYFNKVDWMLDFPKNPWSNKVWTDLIKERNKTHDGIKQQSNTSS